MAKVENVQELLKKTLNRLKIRELSMVVHEIPDLRWSQVQKSIKKNGKSFTSKDVSGIILSHLNNNKNRQFLIDLTAQADLIHLSHYSAKKTWTTFECVPELEISEISSDNFVQLCETIQDNMTELLYKTKVHHYSSDNILWLRIMAILSKQKSYQITYCAIKISNSVIFCNRQKPADGILAGIKSFFKFKKMKRIQLTGRHINSLLQLVRNKQNKTHRFEVDSERTKDYFRDKYVTTETGYDFTGYSNLKNYVDDVIGPEPPTIEELTLHLEKCTFGPECKRPDLIGKDLDITVTIESSNILETVKNMILDGVISHPLPEWIERLTTSGRNTFILRKDE